MIALIAIEIDDTLLAAHVADVVYRDEGEAAPEPEQYLRERIEALAEDEIHVALWRWDESLGMRTTVLVLPFSPDDDTPILRMADAADACRAIYERLKADIPR